MATLSAIIITRNEAANIADCLESVAFCDERIVVDSGSTDKTVEIARAHGAQVYTNPWTGYGPQKNFALALATGDWVLSIDADERVSSSLASEISSKIKTTDNLGFEMPRRNLFCGRVMKHSGLWPNYVLRLFQRQAGRFTDDRVHERLIVDGRVGRLTAAVEHLARDNLEDLLARVDSYSTLGALNLFESGRNVRFYEGLTHGFWAFFRVFVLQRGFLDGREGLLVAIAQAEGSYYRYMKGWLLCRNASPIRRSGAKGTACSRITRSNQ